MKYIYGLSKSGKSIINYLDQINESYYCWDDNKKIRDKLIKINNRINFVDPENLNLNLINESFITPGISFNHKKINVLKKNKIKLYRDLELYSRITKDKKIIAVSGTNGKSTTVKLISNLLSKNKIANFLGGNIGIPLLDFIKNKRKKNYHIIELSSFQLESAISFNPFISILLNISPDHLDRYRSFQEYILQKEKIISYNKDGFKIVCLDNQKTFDIYNKYKQKIIPISSKYIKKGIYFKDNLIIDNYFPVKEDIKLDSISSSLFGTLNIENILATYVVYRILNIKKKFFIKTIADFKGLPYRLEKIYQDNYLQVINNSKATNLQASLKAISNFENIYLIVGGRTKEKDFKKILDYQDRINKIYLIGESSFLIFKQLKNNIQCHMCDNLEIATKKIFLDIKSKNKFQTILFSPSCTSFDQFKNFEHRGKFFTKIINKITNV